MNSCQAELPSLYILLWLAVKDHIHHASVFGRTTRHKYEQTFNPPE